jgi:hypothetical protein
MAETEIHVITSRELATDPRWDRWQDPDSIAVIPPPKRKALLENPLAGGDDEPVQLLGTVGGRVAGRLDVLAGALTVEGEEARCLWTSALYVPVEFRQTLLGMKLVLALQRMHSTVGACGISRIALPLYQNLRWLEFELPRFVLVRRSRPVVERYLGTGILGSGARPIADAALRAHGAVLRAQIRIRARAFEVTEVIECPQTLASRLGMPSRQVAGHRSEAWINWLLHSSFDEPPSRRALFSIVDADGDIVGYFLIRARTYEVVTQREFRNIHLGSLQDWAAFDPALRFEHVVLLATRELFRWKVDAVEVCVPDDESSAGLGRLGFVRAGSMFIFVKGSAESPLGAERFATPDAWCLRPAEGDNFFS